VTVKFGLQLSAVNPKFWIPAARAAEESGFESAWLSDHLVLPVSMSGSPHTGHDEPPVTAAVPAYDVFVAFALVAGHTSTLRFGTGVYNVGLRHPFVTARSVATLDLLSGGRVILGIGASWLREEWEAAGLDFESRGRRVDETIEVCRRLWSDEVVEHHGEFFDFEQVGFEPKPVNGPPPVVIGGDSAAAMRRAATSGDGWLPMNHSLGQLPEAIRWIHAKRAECGRHGAFEVTVNGQIDTVADVERNAHAGVDRVIVKPFASSREAIDGIRRFGEHVISQVPA
jgi:probable F420-dependent oxidoreductase